MPKVARVQYRMAHRGVPIPDEIVNQLPDEYTDNLVYHFRLADDKYERAFVNQYGKFYQGFGPSTKNPVGLNAVFIDNDGNVTEQKHWGYIQAGKDGEVVLPGWCMTALFIKYPKKCPMATMWSRTPHKYWYSYLPVGTDVRPLLRKEGYKL